MQGNLFTTILAVIFYIASSFFGVSSNQNLPGTPDVGTVQPQRPFPCPGVVTGKLVNLRDSSSNTSQIVGTTKAGSRLLILDEKNGFYFIQTNDSKQGWVSKWMVALKNQSMATPGNSGKIIAGYYVENYFNDPVGYNSLSNNLGTINQIIPFFFKTDQYGTISGRHNPKPLALATSGNVSALALINNIQKNTFNSNSVHRMLTSQVSRSRAVNGIVRTLIEKGYRGVNIDFENVPSRDRIYLTAFFKELATELRPRNLLVTASVPAKTYDDYQSLHAGAYDYKAIAPYLDQVMVMTYDEHYSGGSPGPVASYPWVEKVIKYTLKYFAPHKILMGIAAYGYDWSWRSGRALTYSAIQKLINSHHISPKWHPVYKVPYFSYRSWGINHQVWYENSLSTAAKVKLVNDYGLRGVAVWRLGYEDPGIWRAIRQQMY